MTGISGPDILGNQRIVNEIIDLGAIECQYGLSVDEINNNILMVYPNPVDNQMVVKSEGCFEVEVYNALGQKIASAEAQDEIILATSDWNNGVYFVKVNGMIFKVLK